MKTRTLKQLLLYNYRYLFAYIIIFGFIAYFLGWQLGSIAPGLSSAELTTAARHISLSDSLNLPLYPLQTILQWGSIKLFGISAVALRLPSVIIGLLVAFTLYHLLKRWFGKSTALLSTAIFISADWFLFIARIGTGSIEFSLWLAIALLCFTKLLEHKNQWLLLFSVALVGLLFCPFGIYAALTLIASLFGCRVFRERFHDASNLYKVPAASIVLIGLILIGYISYLNFDFLKNLLSIQALPSVGEYFRNIFVNTSAVAAVLPNANPSISPSGIFFVRFFELIFITFGVIMLWRTRVNRLNLTVLILSVVLVLAGGLSSGSRSGGLILVPAAIYMTAGIRHLLHRWQRTFPKNPYARTAAFLPLGILFVCVVSLHYISYFQLWPSQTATRTVFTHDLSLLQKELNRDDYKNTTCLINTSNNDLKKLISASKTICLPVFESTTDLATIQTTVLEPSADVNAFTNSSTASIRALVDETKDNSVRWVVISSRIPK